MIEPPLLAGAGIAALVLIAIARPWRGPRVPMTAATSAGVLCGAWAIYRGVVSYDDLIAQSAWTAATLVLAIAPVKALLYAVLGYFLVRAGFDYWPARKDVASRRHAAKAAACGLVLGSMLIGDIRAAADDARLRTARDPAISTAALDNIVTRLDRGALSENEKRAFLGNPNCPAAILARFADGTAEEKLAVAGNKGAPLPLLIRMSHDADPMVRLYASRGSFPVADLTRLARDPDARVRETMAWWAEVPDEDFATLVVDPDPRVRATAAMQPRMSREDLEKLSQDPDKRVRETAQRKLSQLP